MQFKDLERFLLRINGTNLLKWAKPGGKKKKSRKEDKNQPYILFIFDYYSSVCVAYCSLLFSYIISIFATFIFSLDI